MLTFSKFDTNGSVSRRDETTAWRVRRHGHVYNVSVHSIQLYKQTFKLSCCHDRHTIDSVGFRSRNNEPKFFDFRRNSELCLRPVLFFLFVLADLTEYVRAYATGLRLSSSSVCDLMSRWLNGAS